MANFSYKITIKAGNEREAIQKMKAFQVLGSKLDGPTLAAIGQKLPAILKDEDTSQIIREFLELE